MLQSEKGRVTAPVTRAVVCVVLAAVMFFFMGQSYDASSVVLGVVSVLAGALFFVAWGRSFFTFLLVVLTTLSVYIALEVSFALPFLLVVVLAAIAGGVVWAAYERWGESKYALLLLIVYVAVWFILMFNARYPHDWWLENTLTIPFVIVIVVLHFWFRLSNTSYSVIFVFMTLHIVGSHYTYSEVPLGFWMQEFFGLARNHYDRIVHFSFGFLMAYPVREVFMRIGGSKGLWALYGPIEMVLGFSAVYELMEWWVAIVFGGDLGIAYLGTQGDVWDAQKDMALAGLGSMIAMAVTMLVIFGYKGKAYYYELRESLHVKQKEVLGEKAIEKMQRAELKGKK